MFITGRCPGKHEYYSCGGACDNICDKLSEENQTSCSIINIKCNEMCYCEEGYARNKNNICVPFDQCNGEYPKSQKLIYKFQSMSINFRFVCLSFKIQLYYNIQLYYSMSNKYMVEQILSRDILGVKV